MKQFTSRVRLLGRALFFSPVCAVVVGLLLSVVLHELFHVAVHWGNIESIHLLTNNGAIVAINSNTPLGYDPLLEEAIAYSITLLTLLATAAYTSWLYDRGNTKTFSETVFPKHSPLHTLSQRELFELATRVKLL